MRPAPTEQMWAVIVRVGPQSERIAPFAISSVKSGAWDDYVRIHYRGDQTKAENERLGGAFRLARINLSLAPPMITFKAISLHNPYAHGMKMGFKINETRGWSTAYRGDLVICSTRKVFTGDDAELTRRAGMRIDDMRFGCALCVVELYDVKPVAVYLASLELVESSARYREQMLGDYSAGRFIWQTRNLRVLDPYITITGRQRLFNITGTQAQSIHEQISKKA